MKPTVPIEPPDPGPGHAIEKRQSPADVCLRRINVRIDVDNADIFEFDGYSEIPVNIEIRAWVCPWCEQTTEYILINEHVLHGCGMSSLVSNGRSSDCCDRYACKERQLNWHNAPASTRPAAGDQSKQSIHGATAPTAG